MTGSRFVFVDTNLLLYSVDPSEPVKQPIAAEWLALVWQRGIAQTSWQVIFEFDVNARRKAVDLRQSGDMIRRLAAWDPVAPTIQLIERAWDLQDRDQLSYWDSLIVAAALESRCRYLLTEDLQHRRKYGALEVVNPFQALPEEFLGSA